MVKAEGEGNRLSIDQVAVLVKKHFRTYQNSEPDIAKGRERLLAEIEKQRVRTRRGPLAFFFKR